MRREVAELSARSMNGPGALVLLRRHCRHVDRVDRHAVLQIFHDLFGDAHADDLLRFLGRPADVRRRQHLIQRK